MGFICPVLFSARQALAMNVFPDAVSLTKFLTQLASGIAIAAAAAAAAAATAAAAAAAAAAAS